MDESNSPLLSSFTTTLHHKNPPVKTLLSIAGDHAIFARMAASSHKRELHRLHNWDWTEIQIRWTGSRLGVPPKHSRDVRPRCPSGGVAARAHKRSPHHQPEAAPVDQNSLLCCGLLPHQQEQVSCGFHNQKLGLGQRDVF
ncbi:hypothetical protein Ancab_039457 [Ancistrocladus abbreviatus]